MDYEKLHDFLMETSFFKENSKQIVDLQIAHVKAMVELSPYAELVASDLVQTAMMIYCTNPNKDSLREFGDHLRNMGHTMYIKAEQLEEREISESDNIH